jgi:TIGR03009 family protein
MRVLGASILATVVIAAAAFGQGAVPPAAQPAPPPQPTQSNLEMVLKGWEQAMLNLRSFAVIIDRAALDKALNTRDEYKGHALFVKPVANQQTSQAKLELYKVSNPKVYEKYICLQNNLYEYSPTNNKLRVHKMPQNKNGGNQQESFLSFLFGMGANQAMTRYDMKYVSSDAHYHYVRVLPKMPADKGDFAEARLCILRANNLPAQIWYLQPNGNEITWNFSKMQIDVQIGPEYFRPDLPKGWTVEQVDPNALSKLPPAKVRNQQ